MVTPNTVFATADSPVGVGRGTVRTVTLHAFLDIEDGLCADEVELGGPTGAGEGGWGEGPSWS